MPPIAAIPEEAFALVAVFLLVTVAPISIAIARRLWRRADPPARLESVDLARRFDRIEQAMDAMAVEIERIGEQQRYLISSASPARKAIPATPIP